MKQLILKPNSTQTIVQEHLEDQKIVLQEDAKLLYILFLKKGDEIEHTIEVDLNGRGASANIIGLFLGTGKERFNLKMFSTHNAPETFGHIYLKGLLRDSSMVNYYGMLRIEKDAHGADSYLAHHTLLLSKEARTKSIPALEIKADDIKAGHAATMGQMDEETLFYLENRGLTKEQAKNLMIEGFLKDIFFKIPDETIRKNLMKKLPTEYKYHEKS